MCTHTTHTGQVSAKRRGKGSFTDISQWRLLNEDQRNVLLFLISSTKMRTVPFKKNGPIALTTSRDVCEVFWKQYLSTKGVTGIVQHHGRRQPVAQRTVIRPVASNTVIGFSTRRLPFSASPWSTVKGWTMTWGEDTRRRRQSDASPLVYREGVDDDLRNTEYGNLFNKAIAPFEGV